MAEREGFEPSNGCNPVNGFRDRRIRPLCHLSVNLYWPPIKGGFFILDDPGGPVGPREGGFCVSAQMAEREGFEPSMRLQTPYSLSRGAPSATRPPLRKLCRRRRFAGDVFILADPGGSIEPREGGIDCAPLALALRFAPGRFSRYAACASSSPTARFEPSMRLQTPYSLSRGAPSATRPPLRFNSNCTAGAF